MKKRFKFKKKDDFAQSEAQPDVVDLVIKMQQQLTFLEKKIDTLINQPQEKPFEARHHQKPFQRFDRFHRQGEGRQDNSFRERVLHKAICADCNKECEVPFKPSQDRPVYCKDCFAKRKGGGTFKERADTRSYEERPEHVRSGHFDKPHGGENRKFYGKKRPPAKRRYNKKHKE